MDETDGTRARRAGACPDDDDAAPPIPAYVPILLPGDRDAFAGTAGRWQAVLLSAAHAFDPQARRLLELARRRARRVWIDPCTAHFQFEGYLASEPMRALPYGPGSGTLARLWQPHDFEDARARAHLIEAVFDAQRRLGSRQLVAPYFLVPEAGHPWHRVARRIVRESLAAAGDDPVIGVVCADLDALLGPGRLEAFADPFVALAPALWLVMVVNYEERAATPEEVHAVMRLYALLGRSAPVMPAYVGRTGLVAVAAGACGYAGGALELEALPRRILREGLINLHANAYYLAGGLSRLPVAEADRATAALPELFGEFVPERPAGRQVSRERILRALADKRAEIERLAAAVDRSARLQALLSAAIERWRGAAERLQQSGGEPLPAGVWHYLEVLREVAGGPAAPALGDPGF